MIKATFEENKDKNKQPQMEKLTMRERIEGDKYLVQIIDINLPMLEAEEVPYKQLKISDLMPNYEDLELPKDFKPFTLVKLRDHLMENVKNKTSSIFCTKKGPRKLLEKFIEALYESKSYLTMMTNMLYELGEDVNDEIQRKKFDIEYQKYLEKEGRKKRPSKAKLKLEIQKSTSDSSDTKAAEGSTQRVLQDSQSRPVSRGSSTIDVQANRFNNSFCHFDSIDNQLAEWESDEVPEEITHQDSVEDFNPSSFKAELQRIQQANKTAEGFHRKKQRPLNRVQHSSIRRGSAGAIRNLVLDGQNNPNFINAMQFDLHAEGRKPDDNIYDQKSGSAHLIKRPTKNCSPVLRKKSNIGGHSPNSSNSPQRSTLSRISMPSASITDSIESAPIHYQQRLIDSNSSSPVMYNQKMLGAQFSKSNSPPTANQNKVNAHIFRLNVCQTPGQTSRKPFTPNSYQNPRRTPNETSRRLSSGIVSSKPKAAEFKARLLENDDSRRILNTANVERLHTQPEYLIDSDRRPPSTADNQNKGGLKVASFLLKTMLQKRAATSIKDTDGPQQHAPEQRTPDMDDELAESLDLTNYQKSSVIRSGKVPDKSPRSTHGRFKQRKNTSAYSESGGFLTHETRPLSRETVTASSFRHTPRENPQDCDSRESFHQLQERQSGNTSEQKSPHSHLEEVSVFERDSLDGSDDDEEIEHLIMSERQQVRQSTPLPQLHVEERKEGSPKSKKSSEVTPHIDLETDSSDLTESECEYSDSEGGDQEDASSQASNEQEQESGSRMNSRIGSRMEQNLKGGNVFQVIEEEEHSISQTPSQPDGHNHHKTQSIKSFLDKQQAITLLGSGQIVAHVEGIGKDNDPYDQLKQLSRLTELHDDDKSSNQNTLKKCDSDESVENDFKIDIIQTPPSRGFPTRNKVKESSDSINERDKDTISKFIKNVNYNVILSDSDTLARDESDTFNQRNPLGEGGFKIESQMNVKKYLGDDLRNINMSDRMSVDISETFEDSECVNTATIRCLSYLGSGGEGRVLLGEITAMKEPIALKQFHVAKRSEKRKNVYDTLRSEIDMVKSLNHPHIITYYGLHKSPNPTTPELIDYNILMEYMPGGNLQQLIQQHPNGLKMSRVRSLVRQILEGLYYLHQNNVIHRDLKPENILLNAEQTVIKIGDFGISTNIAHLETSMKKRTCAGTPWYMAPEIILSEPYSFGVDIWSLGCCCFELVSGQKPYGNFKGLQAMFQMVQKNTPLEETRSEIQDIFYHKKNRKLLDFLQKCWRFHRQSRPTAKQLLQHPFLRAPVVKDKNKEAQATKAVKKSSSRHQMKKIGSEEALKPMKKNESSKALKKKTFIPLSSAGSSTASSKQSTRKGMKK